MQNQARDRAWGSSRRVMLVMMSLSTLYNYLYSMMASNAFGLLPIFGGAQFMVGAVATTYTQTFLGENRRYLTRRMRVTGTILLVFMLLLSLALLTLYPMLLTSSSIWALCVIVLALTMRSIWGRRLVAYVMRGRIGRRAFCWCYAALQLIPAGIVALLLFNALPQTAAWQTLGGFGLSILLESYSFWRERRVIAMEREAEEIDRETVERMAHELNTVHAYNAYQRLHMLILMALQVTLVMVYTFIGVTMTEIITCLLLSVVCTIVMREATDWLLSLLKRRKPAMLQLLLIGLFLWMYGLILFYRNLGEAPNLLLSYLSLGLCTSGLSVAITCLAGMEREMTDVAEYSLQDHMQGYDRMRAVNTELAILLGQMIALVLLAVLCIPSGLNLAQVDLARLAAGFRPLLIVPALLMVVAAFVCVLHFPMNNRHFEKLRRFLTLSDHDNPALKKQLDEVVVAKHKNRFGVKIIVLLLRPLYYHKVLGRENTAGYEDGTLILVSNHGELYGPVVTNLYVPISFRPWCISSMMDEDVIVKYIYDNTLVRQKWIPNWLKMPLTKLICPLCLWVFHSLEAIPVYRGNPRELMKTFRLTIEAMQAGDNILVFPERGDAPEAGQKGYASEGVGELYTGFAMIAPAYYAKTHKRAVFLPIYASKHLRTLTFGKGIQYNPEAPATDEKLRIVHELQASMSEMYEVERVEVARRREQRRDWLTSRRGHLGRAEREELETMEREDAESDASQQEKG